MQARRENLTNGGGSTDQGWCMRPSLRPANKGRSGRVMTAVFGSPRPWRAGCTPARLGQRPPKRRLMTRYTVIPVVPIAALALAVGSGCCGGATSDPHSDGMSSGSGTATTGGTSSSAGAGATSSGVNSGTSSSGTSSGSSSSGASNGSSSSGLRAAAGTLRQGPMAEPLRPGGMDAGPSSGGTDSGARMHHIRRYGQLPGRISIRPSPAVTAPTPSSARTCGGPSPDIPRPCTRMARRTGT